MSTQGTLKFFRALLDMHATTGTELCMAIDSFKLDQAKDITDAYIQDQPLDKHMGLIEFVEQARYEMWALTTMEVK